MRRRVGTVLSAVFLASVIAIALATIVIPKVMGATPYTVLSGSMRPSIDPGALVIVRPVDPADIGVGDVVTYQVRSGEAAVVTHRVVGVGARSDGERTFLTQGDANSAPDPEPIRAVQVRGVVAYTLPWMGHVNSAINSDTRSTVTVVGAVAVIGYGVWLIGSDLVGRRRRPRGARTAPDVAE